MIDFRYHLASLAAVFIALAVGMLIGNSFVGLASVEPQIQRLSQEVKEDLNRVKTTQSENSDLKGRIVLQDRAVRDLAERAVRGVLTDRHVALVEVGGAGSSGPLADLTALLRAAGARVTSETRITENWISVGQKKSDALSRLGVAEGPDDAAAATRSLGELLVTGSGAETLRALDEGLAGLHLEGDYSRPIGAVALIVSRDAAPDADDASDLPSLELTIGEICKARGIRFVAAEPLDATTSIVPMLRERGIATVDNIDTSIGQAACVLALVDGRGNYGAKSTADRLLPEPGQPGR